ncbi:hypothetical protein G7Y89_g5203 [Cudoniella acicularis]|uniref:Epoxide hydrolase N-terminal domain-containing protein n=1 Tax=Cudoniella acicularis TaxID=354080 RepID=A0A8H4RMW9_9HELO|nr:hypothetical protein G7Y89_g5203 [Cudoniella acicularis]
MELSGFSMAPLNATLKLRPFRAAVPDKEVEHFKSLLRLSKVGPMTYENLAESAQFGLQRERLKRAKEIWEQGYDWRKTEERINSFPNFVVPVEYEGDLFSIHFVALFSQRQDALPVLLLHGWPGSFLEFLGVLDVYRNKYSAADLPYHIVVPSLPGYGYSSGPPLDKSFELKDVAQILDSLMTGIGFSSGYVAQGGDIGSFLSRILGVTSKHCKAVHLNFCGMSPPDGFRMETLSSMEKAGLDRMQTFINQGSAYTLQHITRPATIGLVVSSSPLALLAWIGEKILEWSDTDPPLNHVLDAATLYWFTESFPRSIYPYRNNGSPPSNLHGSKEYFLEVPFGYSYFPKEFAPTPVAWAGTTGNLLWSRIHESGGHFAASEVPEVFVNDLDDFIGKLLEKEDAGSVAQIDVLLRDVEFSVGYLVLANSRLRTVTPLRCSWDGTHGGLIAKKLP